MFKKSFISTTLFLSVVATQAVATSAAILEELSPEIESGALNQAPLAEEHPLARSSQLYQWSGAPVQHRLKCATESNIKVIQDNFELALEHIRENTPAVSEQKSRSIAEIKTLKGELKKSLKRLIQIEGNDKALGRWFPYHLTAYLFALNEGIKKVARRHLFSVQDLEIAPELKVLEIDPKVYGLLISSSRLVWSEEKDLKKLLTAGLAGLYKDLEAKRNTLKSALHEVYRLFEDRALSQPDLDEHLNDPVEKLEDAFRKLGPEHIVWPSASASQAWGWNELEEEILFAAQSNRKILKRNLEVLSQNLPETSDMTFSSIKEMKRQLKKVKLELLEAGSGERHQQNWYPYHITAYLFSLNKKIERAVAGGFVNLERLVVPPRFNGVEIDPKVYDLLEASKFLLNEEKDLRKLFSARNSALYKELESRRKELKTSLRRVYLNLRNEEFGPNTLDEELKQPTEKLERTLTKLKNQGEGQSRPSLEEPREWTEVDLAFRALAEQNVAVIEQNLEVAVEHIRRYTATVSLQKAQSISDIKALKLGLDNIKSKLDKIESRGKKTETWSSYYHRLIDLCAIHERLKAVGRKHLFSLPTELQTLPHLEAVQVPAKVYELLASSQRALALKQDLKKMYGADRSTFYRELGVKQRALKSSLYQLYTHPSQENLTQEEVDEALNGPTEDLEAAFGKLGDEHTGWPCSSAARTWAWTTASEDLLFMAQSNTEILQQNLEMAAGGIRASVSIVPRKKHQSLGDIKAIKGDLDHFKRELASVGNGKKEVDSWYPYHAMAYLFALNEKIKRVAGQHFEIKAKKLETTPDFTQVVIPSKIYDLLDSSDQRISGGEKDLRVLFGTERSKLHQDLAQKRKALKDTLEELYVEWKDGNAKSNEEVLDALKQPFEELENSFAAFGNQSNRESRFLAKPFWDWTERDKELIDIAEANTEIIERNLKSVKRDIQENSPIFSFDKRSSLAWIGALKKRLENIKLTLAEAKSGEVKVGKSFPYYVTFYLSASHEKLRAVAQVHGARLEEGELQEHSLLTGVYIEPEVFDTLDFSDQILADRTGLKKLAKASHSKTFEKLRDYNELSLQYQNLEERKENLECALSDLYRKCVEPAASAGESEQPGLNLREVRVALGVDLKHLKNALEPFAQSTSSRLRKPKVFGW